LPIDLPSGTYCNVISGDKVDGTCLGSLLMVMALPIFLLATAEDPFMAIHVDSKFQNVNYILRDGMRERE
jgi:hypothetical protein